MSASFWAREFEAADDAYYGRRRGRRNVVERMGAWDHVFDDNNERHVDPRRLRMWSNAYDTTYDINDNENDDFDDVPDESEDDEQYPDDNIQQQIPRRRNRRSRYVLRQTEYRPHQALSREQLSHPGPSGAESEDQTHVEDVGEHRYTQMPMYRALRETATARDDGVLTGQFANAFPIQADRRKTIGRPRTIRIPSNMAKSFVRKISQAADDVIDWLQAKKNANAVTIISASQETPTIVDGKVVTVAELPLEMPLHADEEGQVYRLQPEAVSLVRTHRNKPLPSTPTTSADSQEYVSALTSPVTSAFDQHRRTVSFDLTTPKATNLTFDSVLSESDVATLAVERSDLNYGEGQYISRINITRDRILRAEDLSPELFDQTGHIRVRASRDGFVIGNYMVINKQQLNVGSAYAILSGVAEKIARGANYKQNDDSP